MKFLILISLSVLLSGASYKKPYKTCPKLEAIKKEKVKVKVEKERPKKSLRSIIIPKPSEKKQEVKESNREIKLEMKKEDIEKIWGTPLYKYVSETGLMEVWIYKEFYAGFEKEGKVIKAGFFKEEGAEK